ncbi:uncharacterized protein [Montipora capricornis]|uniref:uncharacterized protein n=1 Tax=Montipora capricornis TaxID=246305 RepID=UPI0035F116F6
MKPRFWFSAVFLLTRIGVIKAANQGCHNEYSVDGKFLKGHAFKTLWIQSPFECAIICICDHDIRCQSLNLIIYRNICELNDRTKEARPEDFLPDSNRFYTKRAFNRVPLGSIQELPAESCAEIKASEGNKVADSKHWIYSDENAGHVIQATCQEVWQKINGDTVCFEPKDNQYGTFNMTKTGNVKAMKLVHRSGSIKCHRRNRDSYWGCANTDTYYESRSGVLYTYESNEVMTVITDANKNALLPAWEDFKKFNNNTEHPCDQKKHFYVLEGINQGSSELVLNIHSNPIRLLKNQELQIWYGQDWKDCSEGENSGATCVDIFAWYM